MRGNKMHQNAGPQSQPIIRWVRSKAMLAVLSGTVSQHTVSQPKEMTPDIRLLNMGMCRCQQLLPSTSSSYAITQHCTLSYSAMWPTPQAHCIQDAQYQPVLLSIDC